MRLRVDTAIGIGALLGVQLVSSFASVGLLARTSPAAEAILREEASLAATEHMLAVLAAGGDRAAFDSGLEVARHRQTDPVEGPLLDRIAARSPAVFEGDEAARTEVVALLRELAAENRTAMERLDDEARFIGRAGAWAGAFLGGFGFLLSVLVYRRLRSRLEDPILGIDAVLERVRGGEHHRRCSTREGPVEVRRVAENVNWLVDRVEQSKPVPRDEERIDRTLLVAVIDRWSEPTILLDDFGRTIARNKAALALWDAAEDPLPALAKAARSGGPPPVGWRIEPVEAAKAFLCRRS